MSRQPSKKLMPGPDVEERYGVTAKTIWVWQNGNIGFPLPVKIGARNYWRESELDAFDAQLKPEKGTGPRRRETSPSSEEAA